LLYHQHGWLSGRVYDSVLRLNQASPYVPTNMTQNDFDNALGFSYDSTTSGTVSIP